jgi:hypothetical protein
VELHWLGVLLDLPPIIACRMIVIVLPDYGYEKLHATSSGKDNSTICMTEIVLLKYVSEGIMQSGTLAVDFAYSSSLCSINYLDVQYSDPQMRNI